MSGFGRSLSFQTIFNPTAHDITHTLLPFLQTHGATDRSATNSLFPALTTPTDLVVVRLSFHVSNTTCGLALFEMNTTDHPNTLAELTHICVHTSHRRQGYGRVLLQHALQTCIKKGATMAFASVQGDTPRATCNLLQQMGFQTTTANGYVKHLERPAHRFQPPPNTIAEPVTKLKTTFRRARPRDSPQQKEVQLDYWVEGSARKTTRVAVPTYNEAEHGWGDKCSSNQQY